MNIRVYQVNMSRDPNHIAFMNYESLPKFQGSSEIDSSVYDKVFEGDVNCTNLEEVYQMFNLNHPAGYKARSLSVSDVVEVIQEDGTRDFHFCDSFGFRKVAFEPDKCEISERFCSGEEKDTVSVLLVQAGKYPKLIEIKDSLEAMQALVGGDIEEYMPFEDEVAIICNEEGKMRGLPLNRAVYVQDNDKKEMVDIICGKFFICYAPPESESFQSLPDDMMKKYKEQFKYPERFSKEVDGNIVAEPFKPKSKDYER